MSASCVAPALKWLLICFYTTKQVTQQRFLEFFIKLGIPVKSERLVIQFQNLLKD